MSVHLLEPGVAVAAQPLVRFVLSEGSAEIWSRAADVDVSVWAETFGSCPKDFAYYQLIEETQREHFVYQYLVLRDGRNQPVALQPLLMVDQDLAASLHGFPDRLVRGIRRLFPRFLRSGMLMAGCLVGDGRLGLAAKANPKLAAALLAEALDAWSHARRLSFVTLKDFSALERAVFAPLLAAGYTRLDGFPSLSLDLNFASFEEFLAKRVSKITRKGLRRKFRKSEDIDPPLTLEVSDECETSIDEIYPLYLAVAQRSEVSFEVFTREYFLEAARRLPGRHRYFIWRQGPRAVAFSFCTIWGDTIYDNDIGLDYAVAHDLALYYRTFRDLIDWSLQHGLRRYASAPFNYDPKLRLRMQLVPVDLYVRHSSPILNFFIRRFAPFFAPAKSDPVLRRHAKESAARR